MSQSMMLVEKCNHRLSWYDLDTGDWQGSVALPNYPHEFVVDQELRYAYVAHYGARNSGAEGTEGRSVIVVDIRKQEVVHTYDLGEHARPHGIGMDAAGRLYVLSEWTAHLLIKENPRAFDQGWDHIVPTGGERPHLFALSSDGQNAYAMNLATGDLTYVKPYDKTVSPVSFKTGEKPEGRYLREDAGLLYTSERISNTVTVFDTKSLKVLRQFPTPNDPFRVYYDPKRNRLVTLNHHGGSFSVFDEATGQMLHEQKTPANPLVMCIDDHADFAYIAINCDQVQRFSLETFEVVQTYDIGKEPDAIAILPDGFSKHWSGSV